MRILLFFLMICICNTVNAQKFELTDNLLLTEIAKKKYYRSYKKSGNRGLNFIDGKKLSPKMDYLIGSSVINNQIKGVWGDDYNGYEEFGWGYYELNNNDSYKFLIIVDMPINPIAYLLKADLQIAPITIHGAGVLTKDNIYITEKMYDSDETIHLTWYLISGSQVKRVAELEDKSFDYVIMRDSVIPGTFVDNNGNYYCAIENKMTHKRKYYIIKLCKELEMKTVQ